DVRDRRREAEPELAGFDHETVATRAAGRHDAGAEPGAQRIDDGRTEQREPRGALHRLAQRAQLDPQVLDIERHALPRPLLDDLDGLVARRDTSVRDVARYERQRVGDV